MPEQATSPQEKQEKEQKPTTILLVRHGQNDWVGKNKLAGWTPGVHLNEQGQKQAESVGQRLAQSGPKIDAIYASPLERTLETAHLIANYLNLPVHECGGIGEVEYGEWTGKAIKELVKDPHWQVIQFHPSKAKFPKGETLYQMQARAVQEIDQLVSQHPEQTLLLVSHADLIKSLIAHYLGVHLDLFQRIVVSPAAITTISFTPLRPMIEHVNDASHLPPEPKKEEKDEES